MSQDKSLINFGGATVGRNGVYSIEFHETQLYTHVKRANHDGTETYFSLSAGGGSGTTDYIQTLELVDNGLSLSSTGIGNAFNTTLDVTPLRLGMVTSGYLSGNSPSTVYVGGSTPAQNGHVNGDWIIDLDTSNIWYLANADTNVWIQSQGGGSADTNDFISNVSLSGTDLEFTGTGGAFNGTVPLASLVSSSAETNIIPYTGGTINTDTVSIYGLREGAEKLELVRTVASDTHFILQGGTGVLGTNNFGIIVVYVTINCSGLGGINLQYMDLLNNPTPIHGANHLTSGNFALTFAYFGTTGLQLIASTEL